MVERPLRGGGDEDDDDDEADVGEADLLRPGRDAVPDFVIPDFAVTLRLVRNLAVPDIAEVVVFRFEELPPVLILDLSTSNRPPA